MIKALRTRWPLTLSCLSIVLVAPAAQAAVISIGDTNPAGTLTLQVARPTTKTSPGDGNNPGVGNHVLTATADLEKGSNGVTFIRYTHDEKTGEYLSFTFTSPSKWKSSVYEYRYLTDPDGKKSDLFVIRGKVGSNNDYVDFYSAGTDGKLPTDNKKITDVIPNVVFADQAVQLADMPEQAGKWLLARDTGFDQYYIQSAEPVKKAAPPPPPPGQVPEPTTLATFSIGMAALVAFGWLRRRQAT
jgi:hypothetical protein